MGRGLKSIAGPLFFAVVACLLFGGAYAMWPAELFSAPDSGIAAASLLRGFASLVLVTIGLEFLAALVVVVMTDS